MGLFSSRTRGGDNTGHYYGSRHRQQQQQLHNPHQYRQELEDISRAETETAVGMEEFKHVKRKRKKKHVRYRKFNPDNVNEDIELEEEEEEDDDEEEGDEQDQAGDEEEDLEEQQQQQEDREHAMDRRNYDREPSSYFPPPSEDSDGFPETLYSVKWYKGSEEFYRYVPKANPQQNSYKVEGVHVDVSSSTGRTVVGGGDE